MKLIFIFLYLENEFFKYDQSVLSLACVIIYHSAYKKKRKGKEKDLSPVLLALTKDDEVKIAKRF